MNGAPQGGVFPRAPQPTCGLGAGTPGSTEGVRLGWTPAPPGLWGARREREWKKLVSPGPGGTAPSGNGAINGSPWGFASFRASGRRGPALPWACGSGRGHWGAWGGSRDPRGEEGVQFFSLRNPSSEYPCACALALQSRRGPGSGKPGPQPLLSRDPAVRARPPHAPPTAVAGRRRGGGGARAAAGGEAGNRAACPDGCLPPSWGVPTPRARRGAAQLAGQVGGTPSGAGGLGPGA